MKSKIKEKISILNLVKGKFLVDNSAPENFRFLIFILFLGFLVILSSHNLNHKVYMINQLKEEIDELNMEFTEIHSKLIKLQLESELASQVKNDCLKSLDKNPFKIIVNKQYDH